MPTIDATIATAAPAVHADGMPTIFLHLRGPGALVIQNTGPSPVSLSWEAAIQQQTTTGWDGPLRLLALTEQCPEARPASGCVVVAPGAVLRPLPWTGWFGCTQCKICDKNFPAPVRTYRFVLKTCDGAYQLTSELSIVDQEGHISGPPFAD